jgi:hypothetical protein
MSVLSIILSLGEVAGLEGSIDDHFVQLEGAPVYITTEDDFIPEGTADYITNDQIQNP